MKDFILSLDEGAIVGLVIAVVVVLFLCFVLLPLLF